MPECSPPEPVRPHNVRLRLCRDNLWLEFFDERRTEPTRDILPSPREPLLPATPHLVNPLDSLHGLRCAQTAGPRTNCQHHTSVSTGRGATQHTNVRGLKRQDFRDCHGWMLAAAPLGTPDQTSQECPPPKWQFNGFIRATRFCRSPDENRFQFVKSPVRCWLACRTENPAPWMRIHARAHASSSPLSTGTPHSPDSLLLEPGKGWTHCAKPGT